MTSMPNAHEPPTGPPLLDDSIFCPKCSYNLRGIESRCCPECGLEFDPAKLRTSAIPWVHRQEIGRFRAYWETAWLFTAKTKLFAEELCRPVCYADAQGFRWLTVLNLCLSLPLVAAVPCALVPSSLLTDSPIRDILAMVWPVTTVAVASVLALLAITGLPSYAFHPQGLPIEIQNRAIALSYYACAPLAWTPLMALSLGGYLLLIPLAGSQGAGSVDPRLVVAICALLLGALGILGLLLEPLFWWLALWRLARQAFQHSHPTRLLYIAALPILWTVAAVLIVGGISFAVGFVVLLVDSLR